MIVDTGTKAENPTALKAGVHRVPLKNFIEAGLERISKFSFFVHTLRQAQVYCSEKLIEDRLDFGVHRREGPSRMQLRIVTYDT
jgi:hypothetical protein